MSFKLTYATMFDPPEELHQRFEAAMGRVSAAATLSISMVRTGIPPRYCAR